MVGFNVTGISEENKTPFDGGLTIGELKNLIAELPDDEKIWIPIPSGSGSSKMVFKTYHAGGLTLE